ncbi:MAG: hypothetical protein GTN73_04205 [Candidatus Aminicenantes bacterium]|nr:hypothetical protein [Candidatus Aminicenantes bacterium]
MQIGIVSTIKIIEKGKLAVKESTALEKRRGRRIQEVRLASHYGKMLILKKSRGACNE